MRAFTELTRVGQRRRLHTVAEEALKQYGLIDARLRVLAQGHNQVYRVDVSSTGRFVLRMNTHSRISDGAIISQLDWLKALAQDASLVVPEPVPLADGALYTMVEVAGVPQQWRCVVLRWVDGRHVGAVTPAHMAAMGSTIAHMHRQSRQFGLPSGFTCPRYDWAHLFGPTSLLGSAHGHTLMRPEDYAVLLHARDRISAAMSAWGEQSDYFGVIHGDLSTRNFVFKQGQARLIDFDEFGLGYYLFDLMCALMWSVDRDDYHVLRDALLSAYERVQPLPPTTSAQQNVFLAACYIDYLNFIFRLENEDDRRNFLTGIPYAVGLIQKVCS